MVQDARPEARPLTIVFADVSGSTQLYEALGDVVARQLVAESLDLMSRCTVQHNGTVVETIGDELFCTFSAPEHAVDAAIEMMESIERHAHNESAAPVRRLVTAWAVPDAASANSRTDRPR